MAHDISIDLTHDPSKSGDPIQVVITANDAELLGHKATLIRLTARP